MHSQLRFLLTLPALFLLAVACGDARFSSMDGGTSRSSVDGGAHLSPGAGIQSTPSTGAGPGEIAPASHRGRRPTKALASAPSASQGVEAAIPAGLRMAALREQQVAPGHAFHVGVSGALESHVGDLQGGADVHATPGGVRVSSGVASSTESLDLGVETLSVGRPGAPGSTHVLGTRAEGQELVFTRDGSVEERYLAGPLGLEQSYRIAERPAGRGPLVVEVGFDGLVPALVEGHADRVTLADATGRTRGGYRDLSAVDATARELAAHMEVHGTGVELVIDDDDAAYPVAVDPVVWTLQQEITASDDAAGDWFGASVSASGPIAIVGAPNHAVAGKAGAGTAYVFVQSGVTWTQQAELTAGDGAAADAFGTSVSISGTTVIVGAPYHAVGANAGAGVAYVFVQSGTTWSQQAELAAGDDAANDGFGTSVSVSGSTAIVGSPDHAVSGRSQAGAAYVFARSATAWSQEAELTASDGAALDWFGTSVSVSVGSSSSTAVVGSPYHTVGTQSEAGAAYVFVQSGASWPPQEELTASDGAAFDAFGTSVSVSGPNALVGAPYHTASGHSEAGAAYVFAQSGTTWAQQPELTASDGKLSDLFGFSVSISGTSAIIGAYQHDVAGTVSAGAAYLFFQTCPAWTQEQEVTASDKATSDFFGYSVAMGGMTAIVGAYDHNVGAAVSAGTAYVYNGVNNAVATCCIAGTSYASGTVDPTNACQLCTPATSTTTWSNESDGTSCNDNNACTQTDTCVGGVCTGSNPVICTALDQCHSVGTCNTSTGVCSNPNLPDGTTCNDNNPCTQTDTCVGGVCTGSNPVICTASDQCHGVGTCNTSTGVCSNPSLPDGTTCNDSNACTQTDACETGVCTGSNPVICTASDQCHAAGTCDPSSGVCSNPSLPDGTTCNDGNACTQTDACQAGACTGSNPVTCTASDQCHAAGTCDPSSGTCSNPTAADGTACNDGNACTQTDTCQGGTCTGSNPVNCTASDQCHAAGTCDPSSGNCSNPTVTDGTACNDGNACTQTDTCQGGACTGSNPVTCTASDPCHLAGTCNSGTGTCSNPTAPDGTPCSGGTCQGGTCTPAGVDGGHTPDGGAKDGGAKDGGGHTDGAPPTDGSTGDTRPPADARPVDGSDARVSGDARTGDAGDASRPADAGHVDSGDARTPRDTGTPDASSGSDAGRPGDAASRDSGHSRSDAAEHKDARAPHHDAAPADAAVADAGDAGPNVTASGDGCGCRVAGAPSSTDTRAVMLLVAAIATVTSRRRKHGANRRGSRSRA